MNYVSLEIKCTRPGKPEVSNCDITGCGRPVTILYHYGLGASEIWVYMCDKHSAESPLTDIMRELLEDSEEGRI